MMLGDITFLLLVPAQQREVDHPSKFIDAVVDQAEIAADFQAQRTENVRDDLFIIRGEQQQVAFFRAGAFLDRFDFLFRKEFHDRTAEFAFLHLNPGETLRAVTGRIRSKIVDILPAPCPATFGVQDFHFAALLDNGGEHLDAACSNQVANIHELQAESEIRLIRAVLIHRIGIAQALERRRNIDSLCFLEQTHH
ncbi:hypothetical protein D3C74_257840 [compost metagenome]